MQSTKVELELRAIRKMLAKQALIMAVGQTENCSDEVEEQLEEIAKDVWQIDRETDDLIGPVE